MSLENSLLTKTFELIDDANKQDPNKETTHTGEEWPKELLYSHRMTQALAEFMPDAPEILQIAARAQHIERWRSKRSDYPEGLGGYKKWRAELGLFHANRTAEIMTQAGYDQSTIDDVKYLIQKRQLKRNQNTQALEDVICIVFLQYYLDDFAAKHEEPKLIDIIQKTWKKMSPKGHEAALKLTFSDDIGRIINLALN